VDKEHKRRENMKIKQLFDPSRDIYRPIEIVISYRTDQEERLNSEISEYIVTDSIEEQFEELLEKMQLAMEAGGEHEIGVWVSGFYGSGKSSFTKYLGLALDENVEISGVRFLKHLQDRMQKPQTRALLSTVSRKFPASIIFLDLASEMLAGATMEEVSSVLFYKVLQWAGYSRNLKVAALERKLQEDCRYEEFKDQIKSQLSISWEEIQNDPLVIDSVIPELAHELYPDLFKTSQAFNTETSDFIQFEDERVEEMIDIIREKSGKDFIIFIIDEVGQYIGSRSNLILNLDGLAKNLKLIGDGKVWIFATAQQTLTEDDPRAALNTPELFKLAARFPIQIDLESRDIKEICYRRLLAKSPDGEKTLAKIFDEHGQALRHNTKLEDAKFYDSDFDEETFINLYPFLPAHFDILLHLLGALAKSTGGLGLRSAIKVIQDILIESNDGAKSGADQTVGWLATTVTLYDALEKDIRRAFPSIHRAVGKALIRYPDSDIHQQVAKSVAVLQILSNMPVTPQNVTSLMHPMVDASSARETIDRAIEELTSDSIVPFGEKEGNLCFFSEKISEIDQERTQIPLRTIEVQRIQNEAIRQVFDPLPSTRLNGTLTVKAGIKSLIGAVPSSLSGERETIQILVDLVDPGEYENGRTHRVDESRQQIAKYSIYLMGRTVPEIEEKVREIYRCREIAQRHRSDPEQEVREYCAAQTDRAVGLIGELERTLERCFSQGSLIFRGEITAVESLDPSVDVAAKKYLGDVAKLVFDRYNEAPYRAETSLAEKFLRVGNLNAITPDIDPLELVQISGGSPRINSENRALISIKDHLDRFGSVDGKRLSDHFTAAPFGWSQDTIRYLIAGLLLAGEIRLRVSGREITVNGQQAIDALKNNNTFKSVGVALREERPPKEVLARAAQRLTELIGEQVIPLEDQISKATIKYFTQIQSRIALLAEKLNTLALPGTERVRHLEQEITDILSTDASDAPQRLGGEESELFNILSWSLDVDRALKDGLETTIRQSQMYRNEILALPDTGIPGELQSELSEIFFSMDERLRQDNFYKYADDLNSYLTSITTCVQNAANEMKSKFQASVIQAKEDLSRIPEWVELTQEEQSQAFARLEELIIEVSKDLQGLKVLLNQEYVISIQLSEMKIGIEQLGRKRQMERLEQEKENAVREGRETIQRTITIPSIITSRVQIDELLQQLETLKRDLALYQDIDITIVLKEE
jgi:hypothetical protein